jgi:hypothetical protein
MLTIPRSPACRRWRKWRWAMTANLTRNRFWRKTLAREAPFPGVLWTRCRVGATARRGAAVRHLIGRPIVVCRWVAVDGGRLECRWSIEVIEGSSIEEPPLPRSVVGGNGAVVRVSFRAHTTRQIGALRRVPMPIACGAALPGGLVQHVLAHRRGSEVCPARALPWPRRRAKNALRYAE